MPENPQGSAGVRPDEKVDETALVHEITQFLDSWKARIDELRVRLDLAKMELRDQAARQLELAQNANQAATSKLRDAYRDAADNAEALRDGVEDLMKDMKDVFDAVQDVFTRR